MKDYEQAPCLGRPLELTSLTAKIEGLYDAIAEGFRSPGRLAKLEGLEAEKRALEQALAEPLPPPVRLHPNLAEVYRAKVGAIREALAHPEIRDEALGLLRGLITRVVVQRDESGGWSVDLQGQTAALLALGLRTVG